MTVKINLADGFVLLRRYRHDASEVHQAVRESISALSPWLAWCHEDFAIEEVARGFRFCMVPLGCGSLRLPEITRRLLKHIDAEMGISIEMMNGQHFEVNWLEDRFWVPYRNKTARQVAATLRHIRGKAINIDEFKLVEEVAGGITSGSFPPNPTGWWRWTRVGSIPFWHRYP